MALWDIDKIIESPQSETELKIWFELYTIGIYNSGRDFPPRQPGMAHIQTPPDTADP
jgi:hypothetical protein